MKPRKLTALEKQLRDYIRRLDFGNDCGCSGVYETKTGHAGDCLEYTRNRRRDTMLRRIAKVEGR